MTSSRRTENSAQSARRDRRCNRRPLPLEVDCKPSYGLSNPCASYFSPGEEPEILASSLQILRFSLAEDQSGIFDVLGPHSPKTPTVGLQVGLLVGLGVGLGVGPSGDFPD